MKNIISFLAMALFVSACSKDEPAATNSPEESLRPTPKSSVPKSPTGEQADEPAAIPKPVLDQIVKDDLDVIFPEFTVVIAVNDVRDSIEKVQSSGGKVIYNPNKKDDYSIGFLVVTLPPKKLLDANFIKSLNLKALSVQIPGAENQIKPMSEDLSEFEDNYQIPVEDIGIPTLRQAFPTNGRGENTIIAVIDSGVDATHPVFQDRVIYWSEAAQETRTKLSEAKTVDGKVEVNGKAVELPSYAKTDEPIYSAVISEKSMITQISDEDKLAGGEGLDINNNGQSTDSYALVIAKDSRTDDWVIFVDDNGDGNFSAQELGRGISDFNKARNRSVSKKLVQQKKLAEFLVFSTGTPYLAYPLILEEVEGKPIFISVGITDGSHGTHVAGIAAGNGSQIKGAAPNAKIMSLKVCSGISCPEPAILRGMIEAFENPLGIIPDVVNISLGSHQQYQPDVMNLVMRDLSAKYGAVFVLSASNSGPGYRSINSMGSFGPSILVGAHVSKAFMQKHWSVDPSIDLPKHNLLSFSSVGPSYTGELRPNIVAPGSAVSSVPRRFGRTGMMNGTSMSSPITAGAIAAMIGVIKSEDGYKAVRNIRSKNKARALDSKSLTPFSFMVRAAVEETAIQMNQYTTAQQGHGLLDISSAVGLMQTRLADWSEGKISYFELSLNGNEKESRIYKRDGVPSKHRLLNMAIESDGMFTDSELLKFESTPLEVRLNRIEIQNADGSVDRIKFGPMGIIQPGAPSSLGFKTGIDLILGNTSKSFFYLGRDWSQFLAGQTIVAVYDFIQSGVRLSTALDVVHVPIDMPEKLQDFKMPGIDSSQTVLRKNYAFGVEETQIKANAFHRYPVLIGPEDYGLQIDIALAAGVDGRLYLEVYDSDGKDIYFGYVTGSDLTDGGKRSLKTVIPTTEEKGIYEVIVSTASRHWMAPTKYELLMQKQRFGLNVENIKLKTESAKGEMKSSRLLIVENSARQLKTTPTAVFVEPKLVQSFSNVSVAPSTFTFKRIDWLEASSNEELNLQVRINDDDVDDEEDGFWGRVDHRLYRYNASKDEFVEIESADTIGSTSGGKRFSGIPRASADPKLSDAVYFAIETFGVVPDSESIAKRVNAIDVEIKYLNEKVEGLGDVSVEVGSDGPSGSYIIQIKMPSELPQFKIEASPKRRVRGYLKLKIDEKESGIPVDIYQ